MKPDRIIIHCSVTPNGRGLSVPELNRMHTARGFTKVGYHYLIQPIGAIDSFGTDPRMRSPKEDGAHCRGENHRSLGICMIGDTEFTTTQFLMLRKHVSQLMFSFDIPYHMIFGHYEFDSAKKQGKTCPNMRAGDLISWIACGEVEAIRKHIYKGE